MTVSVLTVIGLWGEHVWYICNICSIFRQYLSAENTIVNLELWLMAIVRSLGISDAFYWFSSSFIPFWILSPPWFSLNTTLIFWWICSRIPVIAFCILCGVLFTNKCPVRNQAHVCLLCFCQQRNWKFRRGL